MNPLNKMASTPATTAAPKGTENPPKSDDGPIVAKETSVVRASNAMPSTGTYDPVPVLHRLLREQVVFIAWPKGVKGCKQKWNHLTIDDMTPKYLTELKNGNIGVVLGQKSDGLCVIDIDDDEMVQPFLDANPKLQDTLQTHGARGQSFWIRFRGHYPLKSSKLKSLTGTDIGEFRSNGNQSIVWGIHPGTKEPYKFVVEKPVIEIEFDEINWPVGFANPPKCTEGTEETEGTEVTQVMSSVPSVPSVSSVQCDWSAPIKTLEDAIRCSLPVTQHQNNHRLFLFARAILALESQEETFTPQQLRDAFNQWYARAVDFLRPDQTKEDYLMEFLNARQHAKFPLGGNAIPEAWKLAQELPLPPEAEQFENQQRRLLVAFCRQLQILAGDEPFYLSSRTCQRLFDQKSHTTAAKWLQGLCALQIIEETEKGITPRASRYRYLPPLNAEEAAGGAPTPSPDVSGSNTV